MFMKKISIGFRKPEHGAIDGKWSREPIRLRALRLRRDEVDGGGLF